jgi:glucose/arabinose dehydrogenase
MHSWLRAAAIAAAVVPVVAFAQPGPTTTLQSSAGPVRVEALATLEFPWGLAALPDGRLLITEKPGRLRVFSGGALSAPIENVPAVVYRGGKSEQGGLLDVAVDPDFARNRRIYLSYSEAADTQPTGKADNDPRFGGFLDLSDNIVRGGAVARATLDGQRLTDLQVIWRQVPKTAGRGHFGHRLTFGRDGTLFITSGDRMRFDPAQDAASNLGKVVRINTDGSIPKDNPFAGKGAGREDTWSLGHRNMLAAAVHPSSGQLWVWEMGPLGGDELNVIHPGRNYGWPIVSNGDNYDKSPIPDHPTRSEFEAPIRTWTPVISPSGATFYDGAMFPWRGDALVGGLSSMAIIRLTMEGLKVKNEERLDMKKRIRDIIQASDGALLAIVDAPKGELLRLTPMSSETRK